MTVAGLTDAAQPAQPPAAGSSGVPLHGHQVDSQARMTAHAGSGVRGQRAPQASDPARSDRLQRSAGARSASGPDLDRHEHPARIERDQVDLAAGARPQASRHDLPADARQPCGYRLLCFEAKVMARIAHGRSMRPRPLSAAYRPISVIGAANRHRRRLPVRMILTDYLSPTAMGAGSNRSSGSCSPRTTARTRANERRWNAVTPCSSIPRRWSSVA